jgi:hypothetical protein
MAAATAGRRFHRVNPALIPISVSFMYAERLPLLLWAFFCITPIGVTGFLHWKLDLVCVAFLFVGWMGLVSLYRWDPRAFSKIMAHLAWLEFYRVHTPLGATEQSSAVQHKFSAVVYSFIQRLLRL